MGKPELIITDDGIAVRCSHDEIVDVSTLKRHPRNPNQHPTEQLKVFSKVVRYQGYRRAPTVSRQSGFITRGNGLHEMCETEGIQWIPVDYQDYDSPEQELADVLADNYLAQLAIQNKELVGKLLSELNGRIDLELSGMTIGLITERFDLELRPTTTVSEHERLLPTGEPEEENPYTKKILSPIYEPKGERPQVAELFDYRKADELAARIDAHDLPDDLRDFLSAAASRHVVFDYAKIAEYYAHASPEVQALFEESALVIIDFGKAIENGFVVMTKEIASAYPVDQQ